MSGNKEDPTVKIVDDKSGIPCIINTNEVYCLHIHHRNLKSKFYTLQVSTFGVCYFFGFKREEDALKAKQKIIDTLRKKHVEFVEGGERNGEKKNDDENKNTLYVTMTKDGDVTINTTMTEPIKFHKTDILSVVCGIQEVQFTTKQDSYSITFGEMYGAQKFSRWMLHAQTCEKWTVRE